MAPSASRPSPPRAVREAANKDNFIDQIFVRTGIDVEVIEGAEENRLELIAVETALAGRFEFEKKNCLIIEVGTGSTEIIVTTRGEVSLTRTLLIGPLRLPDQAVAGKTEPAALQRLLKRRIHAIAEELGRECNLSEIDAFVAPGASMRFVCRQLHEKTDETLEPALREGFQRVHQGAGENARRTKFPTNTACLIRTPSPCTRRL